MGLILPQRFSRQPQGPVAIDWGNPLTRGMVLAWDATRPTINIVDGQRVVAASPSPINALQVAPGDMTRLGLAEGDRVRLTGEEGQTVEVCITAAKKDELPEGLLFIAYGDISSRMMTGDTHGSGMPTSKGMEVTMELIQKGVA